MIRQPAVERKAKAAREGLAFTPAGAWSVRLAPADRPPLLFRSGWVTSWPPSPFRSTESRPHFLGLFVVVRSSPCVAASPQAVGSEVEHAPCGEPATQGLDRT